MSEKKSIREIALPIIGKIVGGLLIAVLGKLRGKTAGSDDDVKRELEEMIEKEVKK